MRPIDADELSKVKYHPLPYTHIVPADLLKTQTEAYERGWNDAIDAIIESAPTIDAVEVVRCRDCKYWEYDAIFSDGWCRGKHQGNPDWFCADGERKER